MQVTLIPSSAHGAIEVVSNTKVAQGTQSASVERKNWPNSRELLNWTRQKTIHIFKKKKKFFPVDLLV